MSLAMLSRKDRAAPARLQAPPVANAPPIVEEVLNSPAQSLEPGTRAFFEGRFGHDFGKIRVHTDARAGDSARAVGALAYAVGRDLVFGAGNYNQRSVGGRRLLAHELAHTVQQSRGGQAIGEGEPALERDAERVGAEAGGGRGRLTVAEGSAPGLARADDGTKGGAPATPPAAPQATVRPLRHDGLTPQETAELRAKATEFATEGKSTLVGILIDNDTGTKYPVKSGEFGGPSGGTHRGGIPRGPGEGFSGGAPTEKNIGTHIEGHAAAIMREQGITNGTLLSPEPPCGVCSHPTQAPAVSKVLPPGSRMTVVYPAEAETFWSSALPERASASGAAPAKPPAAPEAGGTGKAGLAPAEATPPAPTPATDVVPAPGGGGQAGPAPAEAAPPALAPAPEVAPVPGGAAGQAGPAPAEAAPPAPTPAPDIAPVPGAKGGGVGGALAESGGQIAFTLLLQWALSKARKKFAEEQRQQLESDIQESLSEKKEEIARLQFNDPKATIYARTKITVRTFTQYAADAVDRGAIGPGAMVSPSLLFLNEVGISTKFEPDGESHEEFHLSQPSRDFTTVDKYAHSIQVHADPAEIQKLKDAQQTRERAERLKKLKEEQAKLGGAKPPEPPQAQTQPGLPNLAPAAPAEAPSLLPGAPGEGINTQAQRGAVEIKRQGEEIEAQLKQLRDKPHDDPGVKLWLNKAAIWKTELEQAIAGLIHDGQPTAAHYFQDVLGEVGPRVEALQEQLK